MRVVKGGEQFEKMTQSQTDAHQITTDDLAFSAYLKLKGFHLITSNQSNSRITFTFDIANAAGESLKVEFVNSQFLSYYNELRNLKKLL